MKIISVDKNMYWNFRKDIIYDEQIAKTCFRDDMGWTSS
jgi:hypothetical protein